MKMRMAAMAIAVASVVAAGGLAQAAESLGRQTTQMSAQGPETVQRVQAALAQQGYYPGQVDGQFSPQTEQALKQAQADMSLRPTGQLDQQTLFALGVTAWVPSENEVQEMPADPEHSRS